MKHIEWFWTMKKPQVPLAQGLHVISVPLIQKILEMSIDIPIKHVNGDIYFGKNEVKQIFNHLNKKINVNPSYSDEIYLKIEKTISKVKKISSELDKLPLKSLSDKELLDMFFKGYNAVAELTAFMSFKCTVQLGDVFEQKTRDLLKEKIKDTEELFNAFLLLSTPRKYSVMMEEQNNMLKIGSEKQLGKDVTKLLQEHTKKFNWMGCVMYSGRGFDVKHFENELKSMLKDDCNTKLDILTKKRKKTEEKINKLILKLRFSDEEKRLLEQFRTWIQMRTYVKDMTSFGMLPTLKFLDEMAKRVNLEYNYLLYLSYEELHNIFNNKDKLIKLSKSRQKAWGFTLMNGKYQFYDYKTIEEIKEPEEDVTVGVKGFAACNGLVKGKAIVVKIVEDLSRVEKGDILITHMTTTNFVPILSKVAAIVTDEGGITCHAAIISREMNIPCVIGTRMATKAFNDGDLVEVDANKGIVRKL